MNHAHPTSLPTWLGIVVSRPSRRVLGLVSALFLLGLQSSVDTARGEQRPQRFEHTVETTHTLDYLLALPASYSEDGPPVPLLLFLHGAGERGSDLERVKLHGPPKLLAAGDTIPAIVVSPQCPEGSWWTDHLEALELLLEELLERYNVDHDRVYVTGLSMGGYGTWALAARRPELFAAAVPVCGGGVGIWSLQLRDLPIWAFHGDADPVVPLSETTHMVEALRRRGNQRLRMTVYPDTGHDSWTAAYDDPETWRWLFAQRRGAVNGDAE